MGRSPPNVEVMSRPEWTSVLKLAMLWEMENIRKLAIKQILSLPASSKDWIEMLKMSTSPRVTEIREKAIQSMDLEKLESVERILLAKECGVYEWLLRGYRELVQRTETISQQDEEQLGREATLKLFRLRDEYCRNQYWRNYGEKEFNLDEIIRTKFREELAACYPLLSQNKVNLQTTSEEL